MPSGVVTVRRKAAKYADFSEVVAACAIPARSVCSRRPATAARSCVREIAPEQLVRVREDSLDVQLFALLWQRPQRQIEQLPRLGSPFEHVVPQRDPRDAARQAIADLTEMIQKELPASIVEHEQPVAGPFAVREDVVRQRQIPDPRHFDRRPVHLHRRDARAMLVSERDLQLLVPSERSAARIRLRECKPRYLAVRRFQVRRDRRPARLVDPCAAPRGEVFTGARVEDLDEIGPCRVAEGKAGEVLAQSVAQLLRPEHLLELPHDDRRFLIDDRSVEAAGVFQVVERLPNRVRAGRAVDVVGRRIVLQEEAQLVIRCRETSG